MPNTTRAQVTMDDLAESPLMNRYLEIWDNSALAKCWIVTRILVMTIFLAMQLIVLGIISIDRGVRWIIKLIRK